MNQNGTRKDTTHSIMPLLYSPVSAKDYRWYNLALKTAALSDCRYKLGAAIIGKGGNVLSIGHNVLKSHTIHKDWPSWVVSVHAETAAIMRANCDIRGGTIYICRIGGNQISKPCPHCLECIKIAGIKTIVYSDGKELKKIKVTNLSY